MKDQYAGDVGDYVKLALLRALFFDRRLAVNWFRTANDAHGNDGRFIAYLEQQNAGKWRKFDPELYDYLQSMVAKGERSIAAIQRALEGPGREFYDRMIDRPSARSVWFTLFNGWLTIDDALFLDPDNGIGSEQSLPTLKLVTGDEIEFLLGRVNTLMIYHHQTRAKGGHIEEIRRIGSQLAPEHSHRSVCAIRAGSGSARAFFLVGADRQVWQRAEAFCQTWDGVVSFHPLTAAPDALGLTPDASPWHRTDALERRGLL